MAGLASLQILFNKIRNYAIGQTSSVWDFILFALRIPALKSHRTETADTKFVYFIGEYLFPRIPRLAKWIKKEAGLSSVLLCHSSGYYSKFTNKDFDNVFLYRNSWHLKRILRNLSRPYVVHGYAPKSKFPCIAMEYMKKLHPAIPFVGDYQDVLSIYYGTSPDKHWLKHELPYEKECLQKADGIVAHSLEPFEGMRVWGIKEKHKRLFFPLYCDNDNFRTPKEPFNPDNIHMVYAGGVFGSHRDKGHYGLTQFHWLIDYLSAQKIHFHIYPSPTVQKADYQEYEEIAKKNPFFHFHSAVSQSVLTEELSKYHYGLLPFYKEASKQSDLKLKYATTLKLFNYLEAGIPVLVGAGVTYQSWLIERYKAGIVINKMEDFKDIKGKLTEEPYKTQVERVLKAREYLSLKKHTPRLIHFYESLTKL